MRVKRIAWIDTVRGIAFLCIIYHHLEGSCPLFFFPQIDMWYTPFYLSLFFLISGYLFKSEESFTKVFEQRTRTLLWPLLSLGSLMIIAQHIFTFRDEPIPWSKGFAGLLFQNGENRILWFVGALYLFSLLFYWINRWAGKKILYASFFLYFLNWIYTYVFNGVSLPWSLETVGYGCAYMGLGRVLKCHQDTILPLIKKYWVACLCVYIIIIIFTKESCSFYASPYLFDSFLLSVLGLIIVIGIATIPIVEKSKYLIFIGSNTLFYFAFHGKVLGAIALLVKSILSHFLLRDIFVINLCAGFICTVLSSIILIFPTVFVNKYMPWIFGKDFKLWKMNR